MDSNKDTFGSFTDEALPVYATDRNFTVIFCNEAAHKKCAALEYGDDLCLRYSDVKRRVEEARASGLSTFVLTETYDGDVLVDLSTEDKDNVIFFRPLPQKEPRALSYEDIVREFALSSSEECPETDLRVAQLCEALASGNIPPCFRGKAQSPLLLSDLLSAFRSIASSNKARIGRDVVLSCDRSVTPFFVINGDAYALMLTLFSICSAVGFAASGELTMSVRCTASAAEFTVSANVRRGITIVDTASFGPHAPDVLFACSLARAMGCILLPAHGGGKAGFRLIARTPSSGQTLEDGGIAPAMLALAAETAVRFIFDICSTGSAEK